MQVTTSGSISGQLNYQVFPLGFGSDEERISIGFDGVGTFGESSGGNGTDNACGCTDSTAIWNLRERDDERAAEESKRGPRWLARSAATTRAVGEFASAIPEGPARRNARAAPCACALRCQPAPALRHTAAAPHKHARHS